MGRGRKVLPGLLLAIVGVCFGYQLIELVQARRVVHEDLDGLKSPFSEPPVPPPEPPKILIEVRRSDPEGEAGIFVGQVAVGAGERAFASLAEEIAKAREKTGAETGLIRSKTPLPTLERSRILDAFLQSGITNVQFACPPSPGD